MTPAPFVIGPDDTLETALAIMVSHEFFNHLPVVDSGSPDTVIGFLTRTDILKVYARTSHSNPAGAWKNNSEPESNG